MDDTQKNQFWNTITILYMFLSVLMVLYHNNAYSFYESRGGVSPFVKAVIDFFHNGYLITLPVPMFTGLSGFLMFRNLSGENRKEKMLSRVKTLFIPHICWNIIAALFLFVLQTMPFTAGRMQIRQKARFDLISTLKGLTYDPYDGVLWTVFQLLIFTMFVPLFYVLLKNQITACVALVVSFVLCIYHGKVLFLIHSNDALFYYLAGAYIGMHFFDKISMYDFQNIHYITAGMLFLLLCFCSEAADSHMLRSVLIYAGIVCLYVAAHGAARIFSRSSKVCYGLSFWIYAVHNLIQPCFSKIWYLAGAGGNLGALVNTFVISAFTVLFCIVMAKLCRKWMPGIYGVLSGGRG